MPAQETGTMPIVPAHFRSLEGPVHNLIATIAFFYDAIFTHYLHLNYFLYVLLFKLNTVISLADVNRVSVSMPLSPASVSLFVPL